MTYAKFINENSIEIAPIVLRDDKKTYSNPLPEKLAEFGYLPLIETEMPNKSGFSYTYHYETDGESVIRVWDEHENPPMPEPEPVVEPEQEITEPETTESENESAE